MCRKSGNRYVQILASTGLANIEFAQGRLGAAETAFRNVLELVGSVPVPVGCHVHLYLARIHYLRGELDAASTHAKESRRQSLPFAQQNDILTECLLLLARLAMAGRETEAAAGLINEAESLASEHDHKRQVGPIVSNRIRLHLMLGETAAAQALVSESDEVITKARVALATDPSAVLDILNGSDRSGEPLDAISQLTMQALTAIALWESGQREEAIDSAHQLLQLTRPEGMVQVLIDEGPRMARLLLETAKAGIEPVYIATILERFPALPSSRAGGSRATVPELPEPLSEREVEILELVAEGMSNDQIADRLYISPHTVKAHIRNIYAKLDVHNRAEAAAKARRLGLVT